MKKTLIAFIVVIALGGGGTLFYNWQKLQNLSIWSFVPSDAVLVFESGNIIDQWRSNQDKKIWQVVQSLPFFQSIGENIDELDSLFGGDDTLRNFFDENKFLLSVHVTSKTSTDLLYLFEVNEKNKDNVLSNALKQFVEANNLLESSRQYLGYTITELTNEQVQFSYVAYKNFVFGSFTPFLVEDAIRVLEDSDYLSFQDKNQAIFGLSKIENDQGNIYVNSRKLVDLVEVFTDPIKANVASLSKLTDLTFLDMAINDENIICSGFSLNNAVRGNYLDSFDGVESSEFLMVNLIPINTATLFHFSFDDGEKWHKNLKNFWRKNDPSMLTNLGELENRYEVPLSRFYDVIGNELGIATLETGNKKPDLVAMLHLNDTKSGLDFFNQLSDATNIESDTYAQQYKKFNIRQIPVDEIPMRFFGPLFSGFESCYYTLKDDYLLFANSEAVMRNVIDDIQAENTWGKSLKMNEFLGIANRESNLSLFVKTRHALNLVKNKLNKNWLSTLDEYSSSINQLGYGAIQFSNVDGKYYTNIALQHSGNMIENVVSTTSEFIDQLDFPFPISTKPFAVRNHIDKSLEYVLQDNASNFYLLSSANDTIWSKTLNGNIVSDVYQVDYYKNRKLQYLFATTNEIHIIDRTGTYIPGFPVALPDNKEITFLSLIDYDNSRNYRIMAATTEGAYYMFDKSGRNLNGWTPNQLNEEPAKKPFHLRVRNTDVLVFANTNGSIHVLNRKGQAKKGFPLKFDKQIESPLFIEKGASLSTTNLTCLTEDGELIKFNLEGKIVDSKQLFRNKTNDKFRLILSSDERSYMILRIDENQAAVLNMNGEEKFIHNYPLSIFSAQYYTFSSENQIYVLTDSEQEFTYLYDSSGKLMGRGPINTGNRIAMLYQTASDSYKIFLTYGNHFSTLRLNR